MTHDEIAAFVARWDAARARPVDLKRIVLEEIAEPRPDPTCPCDWCSAVIASREGAHHD